MMTVSPIFLPRFVVGLPALFAIAAVGAEAIVTRTSRLLGYSLLIVGLAYVTIVNIHIYFIEYPALASQGLSGDMNAYNATTIAHVMAAEPARSAILFGQPYFDENHPTFRFLHPRGHLSSAVYHHGYTTTIETASNTVIFLLPQYDTIARSLAVSRPWETLSIYKDSLGNPQLLMLK